LIDFAQTQNFPGPALSHDKHVSRYYFLADHHALIKCHEPVTVSRPSLEIAATWLPLGLDTKNAVCYQQLLTPH